MKRKVINVVMGLFVALFSMVGCSTNFSSLKTASNNGYEIIVTQERTVMDLAYKAITQQFPMDSVSKMSGTDLGYTWVHQPLIDQTSFKFLIEKHLGEIVNGSKVEGFSYHILTSGTRMFEESLNVNPLIEKFESLLKQGQIEKITVVKLKPILSTSQNNVPENITTSNEDLLYINLTNLKKLLDNGTITKEEFEQQKMKILSKK
ncbi:MAG: SHOCT domain-containing protein [Deltaproteobacteria bacterium]|nr:SHOCT domain-containing protein [Deltaproteobacteria bacterium]